MQRRPLTSPPRWWSPNLSPRWIRFWGPLRWFLRRRVHHVREVVFHGIDGLREEMSRGRSVLITPNHPGSADPFVVHVLADKVGVPFYFMAAWQVFGNSPWLAREVMRQHGVFSVDREGADLHAFKQAVEILARRKHPLVIFPEGEVYHINDRVTPFREGPAAIALTAAKRSGRPVSIIPAALKYHYLEDPIPVLKTIMDQLESHVLWRPRPDLSLTQRIYRFAEGALAMKELEYLGNTREGRLPQRIHGLSEHILSGMEECYGRPARDASIPQRIKSLRQRMTRIFSEEAGSDRERRQCEWDAEDLHLVVQLFTYPGDYVAESPSVERIAETIDKFAEDVLGKRRASVCALRRITLALGEPIVVEPASDHKQAAALSHMMEERVQGLLDHMPPPVVQFKERSE